MKKAFILISLLTALPLMAKYSISTAVLALGINFADATTRFTPIAGLIVNNSTVGFAEIPVREAGTFNNAFVYVRTNDVTAASTITLQDSQVDTAVVISIGASVTGVVENTANSATMTATDEAVWEITVPSVSGAKTLNISLLGITFAPTTATNTVSWMTSANNGPTISTASVTRFITPGGLLLFAESTENRANRRILTSITSSKLFANVYTNGRSTASTLTSRVNDAPGGQTVSISGGATGIIEDPSGSDSLANGNDFNYAITTGTGTGNLGMYAVGSMGLSTDDMFYLTSADTNEGAISFNVTTYSPVNGDMSVNITTANTQIYPRFNLYASNLYSYVDANTIATSASTITLMDNGLQSTLQISIAAGATGLISDGVDTITLSSGADEMNYQIITPNTSGTLTLEWIGMLGTETASGPPSSDAPVQIIMSKLAQPDERR